MNQLHFFIVVVNFRYHSVFYLICCLSFTSLIQKLEIKEHFENAFVGLRPNTLRS